MLTPGIAENYANGVDALSGEADLIVRGEAGDSQTACRAALFAHRRRRASSSSEALQAEVFGSSSLIVRCADAAEMRTVAEHIEGQLTATMHADESDHDDARLLLPLAGTQGRAEFCSTAGPPVSRSATPWCTAAPSPPRRTRAAPRSVPARSSASCGRSATRDVPKSLLPSAIADDNPDHLWRRIDGRLTQD